MSCTMLLVPERNAPGGVRKKSNDSGEVICNFNIIATADYSLPAPAQ